MDDTAVLGANISRSAIKVPRAPHSVVVIRFLVGECKVWHCPAPVAVLNGYGMICRINQICPQLEVFLGATFVKLHAVKAKANERVHVSLILENKRNKITNGYNLSPQCKQKVFTFCGARDYNVGRKSNLSNYSHHIPLTL